jgi:DNA polymerase III subunit delta'
MFDRLAGNDEVKARLRRLLAEGRVPNALLFTGPEGIGKQALAFELARAFVCTAPIDHEGCGECSACRRVETFVLPEPTEKSKDDYKRVFYGEHADVGKVVSYKRNILVDAIRELERAANFRPFEARSRFFVIDNADRMNEEASNALLKTLEEPPSTSFIVLVTTRPDSLLPTIRSRCQTIRFCPLTPHEIEAFLLDCGRSADDARLASRVSSGSLGRAISLDLDDFRDRRELMLGVLESAALHHDAASLLRTAEQMNDAKNKDRFEDSLAILETLIRDAWLLGNRAAPGLLVNIDVMERLSPIASSAPPHRFAKWLDEIEMLRQNLAVNINRKIAADALFVEMAG